MMDTDRELRSLTTRESMALLATVPVGRVVFTHHALPTIRPVNFVMDGASVVLRTGSDGSLAELDQVVVAFEADQIDERTRCGWSVLVLGKAERITDIDQLVRLAGTTTRSWAPAPRDFFLRIPFDMVTGRRLALPSVDVSRTP